MATEPEPLNAASFVIATLKQTWAHLPLAIGSGLVFSAFCTPSALLLFLGHAPMAIVSAALLVSPAWSLLLYILLHVAEDRVVFLPGLVRVYAHYWKSSVHLSIFYALPALALWYLRPNLQQETVDAYAWTALYASLIWAALAWAAGLYAYPLIVVHDLSAMDSLRNGTVLAARHAMHSVGLTGMAILFIMATGIVGLPLLFFLPAPYGMFVVNNFRLVTQTETGA